MLGMAVELSRLEVAGAVKLDVMTFELRSAGNCILELNCLQISAASFGLLTLAFVGKWLSPRRSLFWLLVWFVSTS
jgi:hypothetical protein